MVVVCPPGLCIALVGMSLAMINFGLDEVLNPKLRTARSGRAIRTAAPSPAVATGSSVVGAGVANDAVALDDQVGRDDRAATIDIRGTGAGVGPPVTSGENGTVDDDSLQNDDVLLQVRHLNVRYGQGPGAVHAVNDLSVDLRRGEVLGIAGESGCGKSTLVYALCRILRPPAFVDGGTVTYYRREGSGKDLLSMSEAELSNFRWQELAVVFQSAMNALNPVIDVRSQLVDSIKVHRPQWSNQACRDRATELLSLVHISPDRLNSYPHELSGGMRQRVCIAMAMALEPAIVVMDEPTTALDVVVQREILEELVELRTRLDFSVIFVTHDLSLLMELADRIAIMYAGRIVELSPARDIYRRPAHPYTAGLGGCFPALHGPLDIVGMPGSPPDLRALGEGCSFVPRCPYRMPICANVTPALLPGRSPSYGGSLVACHLHDPRYSESVPVAMTREVAPSG